MATGVTEAVGALRKPLLSARPRASPALSLGCPPHQQDRGLTSSSDTAGAECAGDTGRARRPLPSPCQARRRGLTERRAVAGHALPPLC